MTKEELAELNDEELSKKYKSIKSMTMIFILLIIVLLYFEITAYQSGADVSPMSIITLCTIAGFVSLLPDLKKLRAEISSRI